MTSMPGTEDDGGTVGPLAPLHSSGDIGPSEVILRTYPAQTGQWQVSSAGGSLAVWSPRSDAIYYRDLPGQIMRVAVRRNRSSVTLDTPTPVARPSSLLARVGYDISRDGKRLLMVQEVKTDEQRVVCRTGWLA